MLTLLEYLLIEEQVFLKKKILIQLNVLYSLLLSNIYLKRYNTMKMLNDIKLD